MNEKISNKFYSSLGVKLLERRAALRHLKDLSLIRKLCRKSDKILDLACGYGRVALPLLKEGYDIIGVDANTSYIKEARSRARKFKSRFVVGSMTKIPFEKESFDRIYCIWSSLTHLLTKKEQVRALNEIHRVLKPNGIVFVEMFNGDKTWERKAKERGAKRAYGRVWKDIVEGETITEFAHNKSTLTGILRESQFSRYKVQLKRLFGGRRLVAYFYK